MTAWIAAINTLLGYRDCHCSSIQTQPCNGVQHEYVSQYASPLPTGVPVLALSQQACPPTQELPHVCAPQVTLLDASPDPGGLSATSTSASGQVIEPGIKGKGRGVQPVLALHQASSPPACDASRPLSTCLWKLQY